MPSFDITSEFNQQEVTKAIDQMIREIVNRYDFKNTNTSVNLSNEIILLKSNTEERLLAADQVLREKFAKKNDNEKLSLLEDINSYIEEIEKKYLSAS